MILQQPKQSKTEQFAIWISAHLSRVLAHIDLVQSIIEIVLMFMRGVYFYIPSSDIP